MKENKADEKLIDIQPFLKGLREQIDIASKEMQEMTEGAVAFQLQNVKLTLRVVATKGREGGGELSWHLLSFGAKVNYSKESVQELLLDLIPLRIGKSSGGPHNGPPESGPKNPLDFIRTASTEELGPVIMCVVDRISKLSPRELRSLSLRERAVIERMILLINENESRKPVVGRVEPRIKVKIKDDEPPPPLATA
jgi:hypothetical protein